LFLSIVWDNQLVTDICKQVLKNIYQLSVIRFSGFDICKEEWLLLLMCSGGFSLTCRLNCTEVQKAEDGIVYQGYGVVRPAKGVFYFGMWQI